MTDDLVTFYTLQLRLMKVINWRIDNGEYTERGLARILGISQPQMHNVRKGVRKLSVALADRILAKFGISVLDLLEEGELLESLAIPNPHRQEKAKRKPPLPAEDSRAPWRTKTG